MVQELGGERRVPPDEPGPLRARLGAGFALQETARSRRVLTVLASANL